MWTKESMVDLIDTKLGDYRLILVSNREPYVHHYAGSQIELMRPASGLTIALEPLMRASGGVWIAHGGGDADSHTVDEFNRVQVPPEDPRFTLRRVFLNKEQESRYYYGLANGGLWPLCHVVFTRPVFSPEDWQAYRDVNRRFADAVLQEAGDGPAFVFIQDYHFGLLPRFLKERNPNLIVAQFWHIPWPNVEVFRGFPWKEELLEGMLGNDLLGFQLRSHCQNFLDAVDSNLEARADKEKFEVIRGGKPTSVRPFPISIDFETHDAAARSHEVDLEMDNWLRQIGLDDQMLGIGIDRIDYTKGISERLRALDRFLTNNPKYWERVVFLQIGVPSRSRIRQYQMLEDEIETLVEEINWKWSGGSWRPIIFIKKNVPQVKLMALHRLASFCMVTSLHDGMNLVAKEFVASRFDEDGVLILSEFTGASRELTDAIMVNPFDEEQGAEAIRQALELPREERQRRMVRMRTAVAENNIYRWAGKVISTLSKFEVPQAAAGTNAIREELSA